MTQLENEYGSYQRKDPKYMEWLKTFWTRKGFGPFYTSDGAGEHYLKGSHTSRRGRGAGPRIERRALEDCQQVQSGRPCLLLGNVSWLAEALGEGNWNPTPEIVDHVRWFMDKGRSFSLFVFTGAPFRLHGGSQ